MKVVQRVQTFDGEIHETQVDAVRHLEKMYGDLLLKACHKMVGMNYTQLTDYVDANLDQFVKMKQVKDDRVLTGLDEDDN